MLFAWEYLRSAGCPYLQNNRSVVAFEDEPTIAAILNQILQAKGREDLVETLSDGSRYWDVNFFALRRYGTIEFRFQESSLSADRICRWGDWVVKFVKYAISASKDDLLTLSQSAEAEAREQWKSLNSMLGFSGALPLNLPSGSY